MKGTLVRSLVAVVGLLALSAPILAHHGSRVSYDLTKQVTMKGVVTEYQYQNPHIYILYDVKDDSGKVEKWIAETASPQRLFSFGWNAKTLKAGDKITVTGAQLKDGQKIVSVIKVVGGNAPALTTGAAE